MEMNFQISPESVFRLIRSCARERLNPVSQNASILSIIEQFIIYHDKAREGHHGKTTAFWLSVIDQLLSVHGPVAPMSRFPLLRIQRANHYLACFKRAAEPFPEIPKPFDDGQS